MNTFLNLNLNISDQKSLEDPEYVIQDPEIVDFYDSIVCDTIDFNNPSQLSESLITLLIYNFSFPAYKGFGEFFYNSLLTTN